jgi:hypothetical protein
LNAKAHRCAKSDSALKAGIFRYFPKSALLALVLALPSGAALASARDDVMSGSARCSAIADGRSWLNCYYGAAQPMRAELRLPPAPPAQVSLVPSTYSGLGAAPARGDARDDVMSGSARCAAIGDNRIWLDCYYGAAQPMRAELGLMAAPAAQTGLVAMPTRVRQGTAKKDQGFFNSLLGNEKLAQGVPVTGVKYDAQGGFTVTLSNGETWRQASVDDTTLIKWKKPASSYRASIYSGALSSFTMIFDGDPTMYRVRRVTR